MFRRLIATIVLAAFVNQQVLLASDPNLISFDQNAPRPVKSIEDATEPAQSAPIPQPHAISDSTGFLQGDSPLSTATADTVQTEEEVPAPLENEKAEVKEDLDYEYERYEFEDALDQLRPEYASAVIVKDITKEDLKHLLDLSIEVGIIVLHGEIILFTSGSEDEIGVLPAVKDLVGKASFISHTHPNEFSNEGPSAGDIHEAVDAPGEEYVITRKGIYAYNHEGVLFDGKVQSYDWYLEKINQAVTDSKVKDQTLARADLNQFISSQDRYNHATDDQKALFRQGGTFTYTTNSSAYLQPIQVPVYGSLISSSTAATTYSYDAIAKQYSLNYSVPNSSDTSGLKISFDDPATTGVIETRSFPSTMLLSLKGPAASVTMYVVDNLGRRDSFVLTNVSNTEERFWRLSSSYIWNADRYKIASLEFVVANANTTSTTRTGSELIKLLDFLPPPQPVITTTLPPAISYTSFHIKGTKTSDETITYYASPTGASYGNLTYPTSITWEMDLYLTQEGQNSFLIGAYVPIGAQSALLNVSIVKDTRAPTGSIDINSGAQYTNSNQVTLNLQGIDSGSGVSQMSFSLDNVNWSAPEPYQTQKTYAFSTVEGTKTIYVKFFDQVGYVSPVYSKSITLDTTLPEGTVKINNDAPSTNSRDVTLNLTGSDSGSGVDQMRFSTDGGGNWTNWVAFASTTSISLPDGDGIKTVQYQLKDKAGNVATSSDTIELNQNASVLSFYDDFNRASVGADWKMVKGKWLIQGGKLFYERETVGCSSSCSFDEGGVSGGPGLLVMDRLPTGNDYEVQARFQITNGASPEGLGLLTRYIDSGNFYYGQYSRQSGKVRIIKVKDGVWTTLAEANPPNIQSGSDHALKFKARGETLEFYIDGIKLLEARDSTFDTGSVGIYTTAENSLIDDFSLSTLSPLPPPGIQFLSAASTSDSNYTLVYTVDGERREESWRLEPGVNKLLVRASTGESTSAFASFDVFLNQPESPSLPSMPEIPVLSQDLVSITTQDGLIIKYDNGNVAAVEKPGEFTLYLPVFDLNSQLTGGMVVFNNGDRLLFQDSRPVLKMTSQGEKIHYGNDGKISFVVSSDGNKTRFVYRVDLEGKVVSILTMEDSGTATLYGATGEIISISKTSGGYAHYVNGMLEEYKDDSGNVYEFKREALWTNGQVTGFSTKLNSVTPAGASVSIPVGDTTPDLTAFPSAKQTLEDEIFFKMDFDRSRKMKKMISGKGEVLELSNGLLNSFQDALGNKTLITNFLNSAGGLESVLFTEGNLSQGFSGITGALSSITLSDGTQIGVTSLKADEIMLQDGSALTNLKWNGTTLTDFIRTKPDGTKEIYESSKLIRTEESNGNVTTYVRFGGEDHPDMMTTKDGRTYKFIEYQNELGLKERVAELISMDLEDGSRIEFENGKPVRYIQTKQVQLDPWEVPLLPEGESFIPSVTLGNAELRAVTIDAEANILSGEILFRDGTQYIIKDGVIFKQITPDGQILEIKTNELPPIEPPLPIKPDPLTSAEIAYKNYLIEHQLNFFRDGVGIDPFSGMPLDNYRGSTNTPSDYSQATLVGFWAELLATIARGDYATIKINQTQAFQKLVSLLTEFKKVQAEAGWNGMVAFFKIIREEIPVLDPLGNPTGETTTQIHYEREFDFVGMGDNLNLSLSLSTVIGALSGITLNSTLDTYRNQIISLANQILTAQDAGYTKFYDPFTKRFRMAYEFNPDGTGQFAGHMDRVFNEFRSGLFWLAARKPEYKQAVETLDVAVRPYTTSDGTQINNAVPFDGNAFQMFWPLIHVDETKYPEFEVALRNFLYSQADFVKENQVPGLISAGDSVGGGYNGKMGLRGAAETDDPLISNVGSIYGTASAFPLAPHYALQFLKDLETLFPGIKTSKGYVDALKAAAPTVTQTSSCDGSETKVTQNPVYATDFYGVDQAGFILSLLNKSQGYFSNYLAMNNLTTSFDSIYQSMSFNLTPAARGNPDPPSFSAQVPKLYAGTNQTPDGKSNSLIRQDAFITSITDPDYGVGKVYNYLNPDGKFHHMQVEFGEGSNGLTMNLGEYLLLPGRREIGRSLLERFSLDLLNQSTNQGAFYTQGEGFATQAITQDPVLGEVRRVGFNLLEVTKPVGLWALYPSLDLSAYDFLSIPVRLDEDAPEGVGVKIELKGLGEVFVTGPLSREWRYFQIPIVKPAGLLSEIAVSIQTPDGSAVEGELYLGPLSGFKVRTSAQIDWLSMVGKTETEVKNILKSKVLASSSGGGLVQAEEVLENFTIDSEGKLVSGILRRADGSTQYYSRGKLDKWVFKNGKTVVFEKSGLASFILDLSRGRLEEGRFYYDQSFKGDIRSFIVQDNFRKRIFDLDGNLTTMISEGQTVNFKDGTIDSIVTPNATLTQFEFADDGALLKAHVRMNDGREFDINQTQEQVFDAGEGVWVYYFGQRITAVETPENGITRFNYRLNAASQVIGVDAIFTETVIDAVSGEPVPISRTIPLSEYIRRPERASETAEILRESPVTIFPLADIGGFSVGTLPGGEITYGLSQSRILSGSTFQLDVLLRQGLQSGDEMGYLFNYDSTSGPTIGAFVKNWFVPVSISDYDFLTVTLRQYNMDWNQDFNVKLKTTASGTLATFLMGDVPNEYKTYEFSLAGKSGTEAEITIEAIREAGGVGKTGTIYIKDISYFGLRTLDHPIWEDEAGITQAGARNIKLESEILTQVGREIAQGEPLTYGDLVSLLDIPTRLVYTDKSPTKLNELVTFKRFDGSEVTVDGQSITKIILPNGTVNEYSESGNQATSVIKNPSSGDNGTQYSYGALRKVTQSDGRVYEFSYEFDSDGEEITVMKDSVTGDARRYKDGKLISSITSDQLETRYGYEAGKLTGAELFYKNRLLDSTHYRFSGDETRVTDERGTTWFYDSEGNLIKHLTEDGYLFEYVDYTQELGSQVYLDPNDYKNEIMSAQDLRAVRLKGYEQADGSQLIFNEDDLGEIKLITGDQAVNLDFDEKGRIRSGEIQLANGVVIVIENYLPVSGRRADGSVFNISFPESESREIVLRENGSFESFNISLDGKTFFYDLEGKLTKALFPESVTYDFTYFKAPNGAVTDYQTLEHAPILFRGVPYPKPVTLYRTEEGGIGRIISMIDGYSVVTSLTGSGFVAAVFTEETGEWNTLTGTFSSQADRFGLKSFLSGIKEGDFVSFLASDSAFGTAGTEAEREEIFALLESMGSSRVREAAAGSGDFSFFGMKGLGMGEAVEEIQSPGSSGTFSSVKETTNTYHLASVPPLFDGNPVLLNAPAFELGGLVDFLDRFKDYQPDYETQALSVYNSKDELVYSERLDGVRTYYKDGKARETFDESGELLYAYEYDSEGRQTKIEIVKAKADFDQKTAEIKAKIEEEKFNALYELAWRDEAARLKIKEEVERGLAALDSGISQLESQRFQDVKTCKSGFLGIGKKCKHHTVEIPEVVNAINNLRSQRSNLLETQTRELAKISAEVEAKRLEVESLTASRMASLEEEERKFKENVLHQEMDPILIDFYREILGRDPSEEEINEWIDRYRETGAIDTVYLAETLTASLERTDALNQKQAIIAAVESFLTGYLALATDQEKEAMLSQMGLNLSETVSLDQDEVTEILDWLKSRSLHFGQSAFLALREMLASRGKNIPIETIAKESILIDILTGTINRFTEGELLISVFSLSRTAKLHGETFSGVKYSFDDLRALYRTVCPVVTEPCSLRVIAHIGEDHFVVITKVTDMEVSYRETTKGLSGEGITVFREEFLKVWAGYLIVPEPYAIQSKKISDEEARQVKGAFFWLIFVAIAAAIAKVAAVVYAVVSFVVTAVLAVVATVLNTVVHTIGFVFAKIAQGITLIGKGFFNLSKLLYQGIKFAGRFVMKGFQFLKEGFTKGLSKLGSGISKLKNFLLNPTGKPIVDALGHNIFGPNGEILRHFSTQQVIARNLVAAGLSYGTSKGLEGLGLNPTLASLAGGFIGAGFLGAGAGLGGFIKSGLQNLILQGVSIMGLKLGLPPPITSALSLVASTALSSYFDGSLTLKTFTDIAPKVASKLTLGGIELIGRSLGLNAKWAELIGLPISSIVGNLVGDFLNPGNAPGGIFEFIKRVVLDRDTIAGAISIGADFAIDKLNLDQSFLTSLSSRFAAAIISDFINLKGKVNIFDSLVRAGEKSVHNFVDPLILPQLFAAVAEKGLAQGFEQYAISILRRDTIEEFVSGGLSLADQIEAALVTAQDGVFNGAPAKIFQMGQNGKTLRFVYRLVNGKFQVVAIQEKTEDMDKLVQIDLDQNGNIIGVQIESKHSNGEATKRHLVLDGVDSIQFTDWNGDIFGEITVNPDGNLEFANYNIGVSGKLTQYGELTFGFTAPDLNEDFKGLIDKFNTENLTSDQKSEIMVFFVGNGFWNTRNTKDFAPELSIDFMNDLVADQTANGTPPIVLLDENGNVAHDKAGNILTTASLPLTLYEETGLVGNALKWACETWFGCDSLSSELTQELTRYFELVQLNIERYNLDPSRVTFSHFSHSGNLQPMIKALEANPNIPIKSFIAYETPYLGNGVINNYNLQRMIQVQGTRTLLQGDFGPPFLEFRDFKGIDQNGNIRDIEDIRIVIQGAGHSDFDYHPEYEDPMQREISRKTNLFMRELSQAANDETELRKLLDIRRDDGSITVVDGKLVVDPLKFRSRFEQ